MWAGWITARAGLGMAPGGVTENLALAWALWGCFAFVAVAGPLAFMWQDPRVRSAGLRTFVASQAALVGAAFVVMSLADGEPFASAGVSSPVAFTVTTAFAVCVSLLHRGPSGAAPKAVAVPAAQQPLPPPSEAQQPLLAAAAPEAQS